MNARARHALNQRDALLLASCVDLPADGDGQMGCGNEKDGPLLRVCPGGSAGIVFSYPVRVCSPYISLFFGKFKACGHGVELIKIAG